ncbi:MAG TPA: redoxin domain-containing protein [Stellaceae bacterium]|nr:redoxin domain-containing protein [Stellaceae bacterium]
MKLLLRAVTGLLVLCVIVLGALIYHIATERPPNVAEQSPSGQALGKFTALAEPRPAPAATLIEESGKTVTLASFRGQTVLVNFWATWCAPCVEEMPSLLRLQQKLQGLAILAVSEDRRGAELVDPFVQKHGVGKLAIYLDEKNDVGHAFGIEGLPTSVLIDRDGLVRGRLEGAAAWDSDAMVKLLSTYADATGAASLK